MDGQKQQMDGWIDKKQMDGWMESKKIYEKIYGWMDRKDRWMVGCIVNKL